MADTLELGLHVGRRRHVAVREMTEVQLDAWLETPLQRNLVDGDGPPALVHGGGEMPGGVQMRAVVRGDVDALDRPALAIRQVRGAQAREEGTHLRCAL